MSEMVFCRGCGKQVHITATSCPACGAIQVTELKDSGDLRTQTAAGLWCVFLGGVGAHWFYLRRTVIGILSLLFFWTGIPEIVAFVNGLQIAYGNQHEWARKYNNGVTTPPVHWAVKVLAIILPIFNGLTLIAILSS